MSIAEVIVFGVLATLLFGSIWVWFERSGEIPKDPAQRLLAALLFATGWAISLALVFSMLSSNTPLNTP